MKIVAFLQNQWFRDPEKAREVFARNPNLRERLLARYLFAGCLTGRRLRQAFGEDLCNEIVWEEVSLEIGGHSASKFPADIKHMQGVVAKHQPDIVLAFGKIAANAVAQLNPRPLTICSAHPAARNGAVDVVRQNSHGRGRQISSRIA